MARELPLLSRTRTGAGIEVQGGMIESRSQKIVRTHFAMRPHYATKDRISSRVRLFVCASVIAVALGGCSTRNQNHGETESKGLASKPMSADQCAANASIEESATHEDADYRIQPGDSLALDFYMNSEFNDTTTVDPNGKIVLRMVGPVQAGGLTPSQLATSIDKAYSNELRNPGAVVHLKNMPGRQIFVQGEVAKPGAFPLQPGMTAVQALALAGGVTVDSAPEKTVLIRRDACGQSQGSKVDLASALKNPGTGDDVALMARDTVVVPPSTITNVDRWVKHYIRDAMPVEPVFSGI
jgi:polysaccharide biosynthesis/export protein PslD